MRYEVEWSAGPVHDLRLISLVDPVMGDEIRDAASLLSTSPMAHGKRAAPPFAGGMEYRFRVRTGLLVRLRFTFAPPQNCIVIRQLLLARTDG